MPHNPGESLANFALELSDPADTDDVVWSFVVAELESPRWQSRLEAVLPPYLVGRFRSSSRRTLSNEDMGRARSALLAHRGRFVGYLLSESLKWYFGRIRATGLDRLRVIAEKDFVERAPTRLLGEFARETDEGTRPIPDFDAGYASLRSRFDASRSRGFPIIVAESESGPYTIAEGLTRLTCLVLLFREGRPVPSELEILIGTDADLTEWGWA
jgi:hypothetical protein